MRTRSSFPAEFAWIPRERSRGVSCLLGSRMNSKTNKNHHRMSLRFRVTEAAVSLTTEKIRSWTSSGLSSALSTPSPLHHSTAARLVSSPSSSSSASSATSSGRGGRGGGKTGSREPGHGRSSPPPPSRRICRGKSRWSG